MNRQRLESRQIFRGKIQNKLQSVFAKKGAAFFFLFYPFFCETFFLKKKRYDST